MSASLLHDRRFQILISVTFLCVAVVAMVPPIPQWESYHHFADTRKWLGVVNGQNVLSNLPFIPAGILGLMGLAKKVETNARAQYFCFSLGLILTCFGSSYYHLAPDNARLVWDRLPMTLAFMSLLSAMLTENVDEKFGRRALIPLLVFGVASIWYWNWTEARGAGDLRPYALVQFYPMVGIPLILFLYPRKYGGVKYLVIGVMAYFIAKLFEFADMGVYSTLGFVSGHAIKHLFSALSGWLILMMVLRRAPQANTAHIK